MRKEKTSSPPAVEYPGKLWSLYFNIEGTPKEMIPLGRLNLIESENSTVRYLGAIQFHDAPQFKEVKDKPFPVNILSFNPQTGAIEFQILGAATLFNPSTPVPYQFVFTGKYEQNEQGEMTLSGEGKVPQGFCPQSDLPGKTRSGLPGEDGENVVWTSGGPTDPPPKL